MSKIEILKFEDVLFACQRFVDEPENDEYLKELSEIRNKIVVKDYLSLSQKQDLIRLITKDYVEIGDPGYDAAIELEVYLIMDGLLAYSNIDLQTIHPAFKTVDVCDMLEFGGVLECIRSSCARDYDRLVHIVENQLSWENLIDLCETIESVDATHIDDLVRSFNSFTSDDNVETLAKLEKILQFNDPYTDNVNNEMVETLVKNAKSADKNNIKEENKEENEE